MGRFAITAHGYNVWRWIRPLCNEVQFTTGYNTAVSCIKLTKIGLSKLQVDISEVCTSFVRALLRAPGPLIDSFNPNACDESTPRPLNKFVEESIWLDRCHLTKRYLSSYRSGFISSTTHTRPSNFQKYASGCGSGGLYVSPFPLFTIYQVYIDIKLVLDTVIAAKTQS